MHEFAVDWIVPAKVVNYPMNGDISVGIKPIKRTTGRFANLFFGLLAQVIALLIGIFIPQHLLPSILRLATR
jgi:hypothetical protein